MTKSETPNEITSRFASQVNFALQYLPYMLHNLRVFSVLSGNGMAPPSLVPFSSSIYQPINLRSIPPSFHLSIYRVACDAGARLTACMRASCGLPAFTTAQNRPYPHAHNAQLGFRDRMSAKKLEL